MVRPRNRKNWRCWVALVLICATAAVTSREVGRTSAVRLKRQVGTVIIKRPAIYGLIGGLADFFNQYAPIRKQAAAMPRRTDPWAPKAQNLDAGNFFENVSRRKNAAARGKNKRKKPKEVEIIKPKEKNIFDANEDEDWAHDMAREQGILRPHAQDRVQNTNREPIDYGY